MNADVSINRLRGGELSLVDEVWSVVIGLGFTMALFMGIAGFAGAEGEEPPVEIEDLRVMSMPFDTPPPKVVETPEVAAPVAPLAGIEVAASDSPVRISVPPPDMSALMPDVQVAPAATIQTGQFYSGLKPTIDVGAGDLDRVFQHHEVDRRPGVLSRPNPRVPKYVRRDAKTLRVSLLIVVDTKGGVDSVRVLDPSGNPEFDEIVMRDVREAWYFTPAMKNGRNVRCLIQQAVRVSWNGGSPFEY